MYLEAKGYNATYNEDKRMKREFVTVADFGRPIEKEKGEQDFFLYYANQCQKEKEWKNRCEGITPPNPPKGGYIALKEKVVKKDEAALILRELLEEMDV